MNKLQEELQEWGKKVCKECRALIKENKTDQDFYVFQTELPEESPELLFVGINPGGSKRYSEYIAEKGKERETIDDLVQGFNIYKCSDANNRQSSTLRRVEILREYIENDRITGINACYFNTKNERGLNKEIWDFCAPLTQELIEILNPRKIIFLFTDNKKLEWMGINSIEVVKAHVKRGTCQGREVFAIPNHGWQRSGSLYSNENAPKISEILSEYLYF
ncbi:MAG: hypothetical protein Q4D93_06660 [Porphyromonas sp.]|nr:hypothetical protein [Porphyromonas sp.]